MPKITRHYILTLTGETALEVEQQAALVSAGDGDSIRPLSDADELSELIDEAMQQYVKPVKIGLIAAYILRRLKEPRYSLAARRKVTGSIY